MNCYYHNDRTAVGICKNCSRGLCPDCAKGTASGLACAGDCEDELLRIEKLFSQNAKAPGATSRTLLLGSFVMFTLMGVLLLAIGLLTDRITLAILGVPMLLMAAFSFVAVLRSRRQI